MSRNWEQVFKRTNFADTPIFQNFADKKRKEVSSNPGVYLIGETRFNPQNEEKFYLVKVGKSKNLEKRIKQYRVTNPMVYHIDYFPFKYDEPQEYGAFEDLCGYILASITKGRVEGTAEWYLVNQQDYAEICNKGFSFFFEALCECGLNLEAYVSRLNCAKLV